jgi:hypothetical protein
VQRDGDAPLIRDRQSLKTNPGSAAHHFTFVLRYARDARRGF